MNIKLIIEYDGVCYHGWQSQKNAVTVQDELEKAIYEVTGEQIRVIGCSRTDAGVHALGQVANFHTDARIPGDRYAYALNRILPESMVIKHSEEVPDNFHSRFDAIGKKYRYILYNSRFNSALMRDRSYHVSGKLDINAMSEAAKGFLGMHDFSAFMAAGGNTVSSTRRIDSSDVFKDGDMVIFEVSGNGFLYNMVRIMAGTLLDVGRGRIPAESICEIIGSGDRKIAGLTVPPQGLYLVEIYYPGFVPPDTSSLNQKVAEKAALIPKSEVSRSAVMESAMPANAEPDRT